MLALVEPDAQFEQAYRDMITEWAQTGETPLPWVLQQDASSFAALTDRLKLLARGIGVPEGFAPSSTYYAYDDEIDALVGAVNIRHWLTVETVYWGHIGYGVRPGLRRRGYASAMLSLALEKCAALGMTQAMAACYKHNTASAKTILKNGGVLDRELPDPNTGETIQQYWINISTVSEERANMPNKVNINESAAGLALNQYLQLGRLNDHVLTVIRTEERVLDFHVHERSEEMFFVAEGSMQVEFDDGPVTLNAGEFIVVPAGLRHRPVCREPVTCLLIEKDGTLTKENTGGAL